MDFFLAAREVRHQKLRRKPLIYHGYSLLEMMIVVAIIGVLGAVAVPSYQSYVVTTNRADAQDELVRIMFAQERWQSRRRTYTTDFTDLGLASATDIESSEGEYLISAETCAGGLALTRCVRLRATPKTGGLQAKAGEAFLTIDSRGNKQGKWKDD
ncbi:MAG: type IV pilin protein [Pseudomonadota bacterium]